MTDKIRRVLEEQSIQPMELGGEMTVHQFVNAEWWDTYINGGSGKMLQIPGEETIMNTHIILEKHIYPLFGDYSLNYLNHHKEFVMRQLIRLSRSYANIKTIKGYLNQIFDMAEMLGYIEYNQLSKVIAHVAAPKKKQLKMKREMSQSESLTLDQLVMWLEAVETDFKDGKLSLQDYLLFQLTLNIGDRKSESYALQWKHVNLVDGNLYIVQSLSSHSKIKSTKAHKRTTITLPDDLLSLLKEWKAMKAKELESVNIQQAPDQFVFTYTNRKGEFNQPLHPDYLNYRLKSIMHRHPNLAYVQPHKLRHTFATLARIGGASMSDISEALTHSNISTTKIYVNTPDVVPLDAYNSFKNLLNHSSTKNYMATHGKKYGNETKKTPHK